MRVTVLTKVVAYLRESGREVEMPQLAAHFARIPRSTLGAALSRAKQAGLLKHTALPTPFGRRGAWKYVE